MVERQYVSAENRRKVIALKDVVAKEFALEHWLELGILTDCTDIIRGHDRLLRSLRFGDEDYPGCVLAVLMDIVGREPANLGFIEDFVAAKFASVVTGAEELVSTAPSKNRKVVFAPAVFELPERGVDEKLVAVMMPFAPQFEAVFEAIKAACDVAGLKCLRVKDIWEHSTIIQDVFNLIFRAKIVVCDFTDKNPNVFYEAGIAHTLGKHVVPLSQADADVPFDLRHHRYLPYLNNGEGRAKLTDMLRARLIDLTIPDDLRDLLG